MPILLAESDLSSVPPEFLKWFLVCLAGLLGIALSAYVAYRKGTQASGTKSDPVNIAQPLDVRQVGQYADKQETMNEIKKLERTIEAMGRENLRQNQQEAAQIQAVIAAGADSEKRMMGGMHDMENRMTKTILAEMKTIHERLNPLSVSVGEHGESIKGMERRISDLWDQMKQLWGRVFPPTKPAR